MDLTKNRIIGIILMRLWDRGLLDFKMRFWVSDEGLVLSKYV